MRKEKIAIVTGGGSGIGLAIAEKFVQNNIITVIVGRDDQKLDTAKNKLGELCDTFSCDLSNLEEIPKLVNNIIEKYEHIDVLVNNAGINMKKEFTQVTDEDFQKILLTNVTAIFSLSREVVKHMLEKNIKGSIVNISSMASQYGIPKVIAYTASKSAIEGMTRAMAVELSPKGIRVNCIAPGFIATPMTDKLNEKQREGILARVPAGRLGTPADVASAAVYLASDEAAYVTGQTLHINGGMAMF